MHQDRFRHKLIYFFAFLFHRLNIAYIAKDKVLIAYMIRFVETFTLFSI